MFSILCPTMWRGLGLEKVITEVETNPLLGEILVINNAPDKTPDWFKNKKPNPKIKVANFGHNIYVNPAWNLGVKHSNFDHICIMNDDIEFDSSIFAFMSDKITPDLGPVGSAYENWGNSLSISISEDSYDSWSSRGGSSPIGWGVFFFVHKANWIDIPEQLKIWKGDDWIYDHAWCQKRIPRTIDNFKLTYQNNKMGTTSQNLEFNRIKRSDREARDNLSWPQYYA